MFASQKTLGHARVSPKVQTRADVEKDLTLLGQELRCTVLQPFRALAVRMPSVQESTSARHC